MNSPHARHAGTVSRRGGYLASLFGALLGAAIGGVGGAFATTLYADIFLAPEERVTLLIQFVRTVAAGVWVGAAVGTSLGLLWRRYRRALSTAVLSAILTLPTAGLFWRSLPVYGINPPSVAAAILIVVVVAPLLSRVVIVWLSHLVPRRWVG